MGGKTCKGLRLVSHGWCCWLVRQEDFAQRVLGDAESHGGFYKAHCATWGLVFVGVVASDQLAAQAFAGCG
jgi:hypothetical protein